MQVPVVLPTCGTWLLLRIAALKSLNFQVNTVLYSYYTIAHQMTAFIKAQVRPWNTEHMQGVRSKQLYSAVFDPREYLLLHTAILDYST
ncbi:hypothetical protein BDA96_03G457300 [Sorghum bicolor]|jgi:hypothetical protein|uniref:Uncharacterized protein n=1 Tax=Sorghum bicolor TaxID=4558 RepID=A0A921RJY8_SORBI|nr:hypothetical protein BDA96_03G457300 [Sorghum bicolor]